MDGVLIKSVLSGNVSRTGGSYVHYGSSEMWNSNPSTIGLKGHLYIYVYDTGENKIKIGDGRSYLIDTPFIFNGTIDRFMEHMNDELIHVRPEDRERWNSKLQIISSNGGLIIGG